MTYYREPDTHLFNNGSLSNELDDRKKKLKKEVESYSLDQLFEAEEDVLAKDLENKFKVVPVELGAIEREELPQPEQCMIDEGIPAFRYSFEVSYRGEQFLLLRRDWAIGLIPRATIRQRKLIFHFAIEESNIDQLDTDNLTAAVADERNRIQQELDRNNSRAKEFNKKLEVLALREIQSRKKTLCTAQNKSADLRNS